MQVRSAYLQVWSLYLQVRSLKIRRQIIIQDFLYLQAIFNLQHWFLYMGMICIPMGMISISVEMFSIPACAMRIPAGMICIPTSVQYHQYIYPWVQLVTRYQLFCFWFLGNFLNSCGCSAAKSKTPPQETIFLYPLASTELGSQPSLTARDRELVSVLEVRIKPGDLNLSLWIFLHTGVNFLPARINF